MRIVSFFTAVDAERWRRRACGRAVESAGGRPALAERPAAARRPAVPRDARGAAPVFPTARVLDRRVFLVAMRFLLGAR